MAIQFDIQTDDGTADPGNTYISLAYFDQYWENHGETYDDSTSQKMVACIRGTEYVDHRWNYDGTRLTSVQETEWPRVNATDCSLNDTTGVPDVIKKATAEYAGRWLDSTSLQADITDVNAIAGRTTRERVGPIEAEYASGLSAAGAFPVYPSADNIIKTSCLIINLNRVDRV